MENQISKVIQDVKIDEIYNLEEVLQNFLKSIGNIYSYLVYVNYKGENLDSWSVQYNVSQVNKYNTLQANTIVPQIAETIRDYYINQQKLNIKYVIGYNQPSLDLILQLYDPLIRSLAKKQHEKWQQLPFEDLCQDCRLVICMLHNKGYYIHRRLVEKSFNNLVLMAVRKDTYKTAIVSLDDTFNQLTGETELMIKDIVPDTRLMELQYDKEITEIKQNLFDEIKELIIEEVGVRGFEQLLRNYGNKTTDQWSQMTIFKLRKKFEKEGIYELLKKRYE